MSPYSDVTNLLSCLITILRLMAEKIVWTTPAVETSSRLSAASFHYEDREYENSRHREWYRVRYPLFLS